MKISTPQIPEKLKDVSVNKSLIHEIINAELSNRRQGNAHTKTRAEVSGGGRKPWRQKGTGRARAGSTRTGIWRGGGVIFGARNEKSYKQKVTKKKKRIALMHMVLQRIKENNLNVADLIKLEEPKTKLASKFLNDIYKENDSSKILILVNKEDTEIFRAFRNIKNVTISDWKNVNTLKLLYHKKILFLKNTWDEFVKVKGLEVVNK